MAAVFSKPLAKCFPDSIISQLFPPPSTFDPLRDIPDLTGKVAIVTGGAVGIGYHTVLALLQKNVKIYIATRSETKVNEAIRKLQEETGREAIFVHLDLADLASVRRAVRELANKEEKLDIYSTTHQLTAQGYDLHFGTNVLGHYYFTSLLKPLLKRSTQLNREKARVVFTSSNAFEYAPGDGIEFDVLKDGPARDAKIKEYGFSSIPGKGAVWKIYGLSKFTANIFQRDHADEFSSYSVHPGGIQSELTRHSNSFEQLLSKAVMKPTPMGALTQLYAGTMPEAGNVPGGYFIPWTRLAEQGPRFKNEKLQKRFKEWVDAELRAFAESSEGGWNA
ncbi:hypothetical protein M422DRAFT_257960 [Sphaerobolus stellatus SS14]|uniref:NAD(P)-binding protein n=1 Tax=Sphaerobolus stellatus (strain SS14) TaxID=990650 RepID=A0A0C9U8H9_SPHS4|nr:hypothetical protein M422DRAFT_257960 [Sphaerobolus stellatus SS14]